MASIIDHPGTTPAATGVVSIAASFAVQDWAAVAGIVGVIIGAIYGWRRDRREQRRLAYDLKLCDERRIDACARCDLGRRDEDKAAV